LSPSTVHLRGGRGFYTYAGKRKRKKGSTRRVLYRRGGKTRDNLSHLISGERKETFSFLRGRKVHGFER